MFPILRQCISLWGKHIRINVKQFNIYPQLSITTPLEQITLVAGTIKFQSFPRTIVFHVDMFPRNVILSSLVQPLNAFFPINVTLACIITLVRLSQLLNAYSLMCVTFSGMDILVRLSQPEKALSPILVTLLGI